MYAITRITNVHTTKVTHDLSHDLLKYGTVTDLTLNGTVHLTSVKDSLESAALKEYVSANTRWFLFGGWVSTAYRSWKAHTETDTAILEENTGMQLKLERYLGIKCCIANHMSAFSFLKPRCKLKLIFSLL